MNKQQAIAIILGILMFLLSYGGYLLYEVNLGYPIYLDNCESIMDADYNVATEQVSECLKVKNHPIINYWLESYFVGFFLSSALGIATGFIVYIVVPQEDTRSDAWGYY